MKLFLRALLLLLSLQFAPAFGADEAIPLPAGVTLVTSVEGINEYRLPNGLRVLLATDVSKPTTTVNLTYLVGSRHENYGETGMAHLLEHLLFKGTPKLQLLWEQMAKRGMQMNGTTSVDRTNYFETFAASEENLRWALDMEADRMINSFIARKDLDSEMTVVRNELEMGENNPGRILLQKMLATAFDWHNYGKSTIGARSDVENVDIANLQAFYRKYYQPDNAVLTVTGSFDEAKTLGWIAAAFGPIPRPQRPFGPEYTQEPVQDGERTVTIRRVGDTQLVSTLYHVPPGASADFAAMDLLEPIMSDTPTGRLHKALVESKLAAGVYGYTLSTRQPGVVIWGARVRAEASLDAAREAMLKVLEGVAQQPITTEELEQARTRWLKQFDEVMNDPEQLAVALSESIALGDWRLLFLHRDRVRGATLADVQKVATEYLKPANRTLGQFVPTDKPERAPLPAVPDVPALVKDYKGDPAIAKGEAFDPSPENIDQRTKVLALPNGMKIALLPKKTRGATVNLALNLQYGDEKSLFGLSSVGSMTGSMLMRGTTSKTRQQLDNEFNRLKASVAIGGGVTGASASAQTVRANLGETLRLIAEVLRQPAFPADEFEQLRNTQLAAIEQGRRDPQSRGRLEFRRQFNAHPPGDVRYTPTVDEQIAEIKAATLDQVRAFHARFYGAGHGQLAIVGDFDADEIAKLAGELFGSWTSATPYARIRQPYRAHPAKEMRIETPDKANAYYLAGMSVPLNDSSPDYPAFLLADQMLGGPPGNRLWKRLREKDGLSYSIGTALEVAREDDNSSFRLGAIYAPENVDKLQAGIRQELELGLKDGFGGPEFAAFKDGLLLERRIDRSQNESLSHRLADNLYLGRTMAVSAEVDRKLRALTPEEVQAVFRKYVDPAKFVTVAAGDFAKKKP
ncbi:MAG: insulinase family protein [Burkholderiales bacterium]|nr:insulinase family protein [Burkholderiales bacterium]